MIRLATYAGPYSYRVDSALVVEPEDTYVLDDSGEAILTLVTLPVRVYWVRTQEIHRSCAQSDPRANCRPLTLLRLWTLGITKRNFPAAAQATLAAVSAIETH